MKEICKFIAFAAVLAAVIGYFVGSISFESIVVLLLFYIAI
ncbi:MAG: hypothetical protein ABF624_00290 [Liquorilactobacillus ghanensis]|jgi:hypothetical protein|nr:hypothetical protein [Liquorilactobacillus nagelii]